MSPRHVVVMVATSYPRFPGDGVGSFMEPIAAGIAARGHEVHVVLPWHPAVQRAEVENGVRLHFFHYAPTPAMHAFGYATSLRADTALTGRALLVTPFALVAGVLAARRIARRYRATIMHGHWIVPGGPMAALAAPRLPLVVSLHGSDVFVAERHALAGRVARSVFARAGAVTAPSADLRRRALALGAAPDRTMVVPYGVDTTRFAPDPIARRAVRDAFGIGDRPLVASAGRLVEKKGFRYLIDAASALSTRWPGLCLVIAGAGDLRGDLEARARATPGMDVRFPGALAQDDVARLFAAADVIAVPSIRDDAGNVDGLPNAALEALATATPLVATRAGGLAQVVTDGENGRLVPERDAASLAAALADLLSAPGEARALGGVARARVSREHGWDRVAVAVEAAYVRAMANAVAR